MGDRTMACTQPNPGWGFICQHCVHTFPDEEKYIDWAPEIACKQVKYDPGGYDRSTSPPTYIRPAPIFELKRYDDGSEQCPSFETTPPPQNS